MSAFFLYVDIFICVHMNADIRLIVQAHFHSKACRAMKRLLGPFQNVQHAVQKPPMKAANLCKGYNSNMTRLSAYMIEETRRL